MKLLILKLINKMQNVIKGYKLEKEIGSGSFSKVYYATRLEDGKKYAIKKIDNSYLNDKRYKRYINNEIYILKNIKSEYTIKFYDAIKDLNYIYLVFEYCNGGDLEKCLSNYMKIHNKPFTQEIVQHIMRQIIAGFVYLHSCKILHRDIKLENILVQFKTEEDKRALNMLNADYKITDFGFARYLKGDNLAKSVLGNPINMDPAMIKKLARIDDNTDFGYDQKLDIWSLGTVTYKLLIGCPAFEASSYEELIEKIEKGEYRIPHEITLSSEAISFLLGMLRYNPESRLDVESLSKQYFLTRNVSSFHSVILKKSNMDLGSSIVLNAKNDQIGDILSQYDFNTDEINPDQYNDDKPFDDIKKGKQINKEPKDYVGNIPSNTDININVGEKNNKIDNDMGNYLNKKFDEMNRDCFYIEPLLIPTQPTDINYNSPDPISKFMDAL